MNKPIKLNVVVLTHNEEEVFRLLDILKQQKRLDTRVFIVDDYSDKEYYKRLATRAKNDNIELCQHSLNNNFAEHRNFILNIIPRNEWIVMLDADEVVNEKFLVNLVKATQTDEYDVFRLPRINTFGDDVYDIPEVNWRKPQGLQYPDLQGRVFKNNGTRYSGKVHEQLTNYIQDKVLKGKYFTILHHKTIEKQEKQNALYENISEMQVKYYSQCGEDKYIASKMGLLGLEKTIVEIGAGRPEEISNSRYFIEQGFSALLIEPNKDLYDELSSFYVSNDDVEILQLVIGASTGVTTINISKKHWALSSLDEVEGESIKQIVGKEPIDRALGFWSKYPVEIGIMSIDTEGNDLPILQTLLDERIYPQVLIVEALTDEIKRQEIDMLAEYYIFDTTLSLSNVFIRKDIYSRLQN